MKSIDDTDDWGIVSRKVYRRVLMYGIMMRSCRNEHRIGLHTHDMNG